MNGKDPVEDRLYRPPQLSIWGCEHRAVALACGHHNSKLLSNCQCKRPRSSPRPHFRAPKTRDSSRRALRVHLSSARATAYPLARSPQYGYRRWQHSRSILLERYTKYATTPTNHYGHSTGQSGRGGRNRMSLKELHPRFLPRSAKRIQFLVPGESNRPWIPLQLAFQLPTLCTPHDPSWARGLSHVLQQRLHYSNSR